MPSDGGLPPPVHFTVLAFAPDGGTPSVTLALCTGGNPYSPSVQCPGADGIPLPDDTLDVANPQVLALLAALDGGLPDSGLPPTEPGVVQVAIGYFATSGGTLPSDSERGVYRLGVRFSGRPNHNPQLLSVSVPDGGSLQGAQLPAGKDVTLTPAIPVGGSDAGWPSVGLDGGIETYPSLDGGTLYENLTYSWYATAPSVSYFFSREPTPADTTETSPSRIQRHQPGPGHLLRRAARRPRRDGLEAFRQHHRSSARALARAVRPVGDYQPERSGTRSTRANVRASRCTPVAKRPGSSSSDSTRKRPRGKS